MELQLLFYKGLLGVIGLMLFAAEGTGGTKKMDTGAPGNLPRCARCAVVTVQKETGVGGEGGGRWGKRDQENRDDQKRACHI